MKALIYIDAAAAVKAGFDNQGEYVIDFNPADLSKVQREELAQCPQRGKIFRTFNELSDQKDFGTGVVNPDLDALKKVLDAKIKLRIQNEKQKAETQKKLAKELQQGIKRFVETSVEDRIASTNPFEFSPYEISHSITNMKEAKKDPAFQTAYEEAEALAFWVSLENMLAKRFAAFKKVQQEQKIVEKMKRMRKQIEIWTLANGTKSQKERLAAGLLPESEIVDAIRSATYAPLDKFPRFKKLKTTDVCNDDSGWGDHEVNFSVEDANSLTADEFVVLKNLQNVAPKNSVITPRIHTAECSDCGNTVTRLGFMVKIQVGELSFSREYGLNEN